MICNRLLISCIGRQNKVKSSPKVQFACAEGINEIQRCRYRQNDHRCTADGQHAANISTIATFNRKCHFEVTTPILHQTANFCTNLRIGNETNTRRSNTDSMMLMRKVFSRDPMIEDLLRRLPRKNVCRSYSSDETERSFKSRDTRISPSTPDIENDHRLKGEKSDDAKKALVKDSTPPHQSDQLRAILSQLGSTPNLITLARILSTPAIGYLIIIDAYPYALAGCMLAAASDGLDGYIAKKYNKHTVLGTYLDPVADKIVITVLAISLAYKDILPIEVVSLWILKDIILISATYYSVSNSTMKGKSVVNPSTTPLQVQPTLISKGNTVLQFLALTLGMITPICSWPDPEYLTFLCWITAVTTVASALSYVGGASLTNSGNKSQSGTSNQP